MEGQSARAAEAVEKDMIGGSFHVFFGRSSPFALPSETMLRRPGSQSLSHVFVRLTIRLIDALSAACCCVVASLRLKLRLLLRFVAVSMSSEGWFSGLTADKFS